MANSSISLSRFLPESMVVIYDSTLSADTASFDIQNIPSSYRYLLITGNLRTTEAVTISAALVTFNNDSGTTYDTQTVRGRGSTASAASAISGNNIAVTTAGGSNATGVFGPILIYIPDYANTVPEKSVICFSGHADETAANSNAEFRTNHWRNTTVINRITLTAQASSNFVTGSRVTVYGLGGAQLNEITGIDGWTSDPSTWTYATSTTFTISGDKTTKFTKGTRIKLTQTTVKYFVVIGSSHSSGTTTVTVTGGTDYSLANATITDPFYSYQTNPQGYPTWFNYSPTYTGFSADPTLGGGVIRFMVIGSACCYDHTPYSGGTSNATGFTLTLPITAAQASVGEPCRALNNGAFTTTPGRIEVAAASATATINRDFAAATWTASGGKNAQFIMWYEI